MSFNPRSLLSAASSNPVDKLKSTVTSKISGVSSVANEIAGKISSAGAALSAASSFAAAKTDALMSAAPTAFSTMAALGGGLPAIERISREILVNSRSGGLIPFDPQSVIPKQAEDAARDSTIYPPGLSEMEYYFKMEFMEYKRPSVADSATTDIRFSITLPIPTTLIEAYSTHYNDGKYGATLGNVLNAADNAIAAIAGNGGQVSVDNLVGTALGAARGAGQSTLASTAANTLGVVGVEAESLSGLADQMFGSIVNPHLTTFFQGPSLREHQFNWTFAPKNADESKSLREIYYRIKRAKLPSFTPDAAHTTLEYPMMVKIRIVTKGGEDLYPFKIAVIPACSMNHAPSGTPAFHGDGKPVVMMLAINFKEIEYFTSDDIRNMQGGAFGSFEGDFAQNQVALETAEDFLMNKVPSVANTLVQSVKNSPAITKLFGGS